MSRNTFALDEITRGIRHAFETSTIPLWVTFGIQTLLDIQDVFDTSVNKAYMNLRAHVQYTSKMLSKDLAYPRPFQLRGYEQANITRATTILNDIQDWTFRDMFGTMLRQQTVMQTHPVLGPITRHPNYLLEHHPLWCGMLKYDGYMQLHATGTGVESQALIISILAHLYAACKFSYSKDPVWPDLEFMMERQDKSCLFFGALPKTFKEAQRKLVQAGGASATNFARGRRTDNPVINLDSTQFFQDRSILGNLSQERMYKEPSTKEATELMRKLISTIKSSNRLSNRTPNGNNSTSSRSTTHDRDWRPLEILEELREWLVEDGVDFCWDWYCMNQICADIWTKIKDAFGQDPESSINGERSALGIAGAVLGAGAEVERLLGEHSILRAYVREENPDLCPELSVVRKIIQETIQTRATPPNRPTGWVGDRCIRRLLHVSPEAVRPLGRPRDMQGIQVGVRLAEFVGAYERFKVAQEKYKQVDAGEANCKDCGERHVPGHHKPIAAEQGFYFCSPITRAAWSG